MTGRHRRPEDAEEAAGREWVKTTNAAVPELGETTVGDLAAILNQGAPAELDTCYDTSGGSASRSTDVTSGSACENADPRQPGAGVNGS
jgi:hypothetical protein